MANSRRRKVVAAITERAADAATARTTAKVTTSAAMAKDMVKVMSVIAMMKATVKVMNVTAMTKAANMNVIATTKATSATATKINHGFEVFSRQDLFLTKECTGVLD